MGEIDSNGKRFPVAERSPLVRASQFGVQNSAALTVSGEAVYDDYCAALVPAVLRNYETVVAAVFDRHFVSDSSCGWPPSPPTARGRELSTYEDITRYLSLTGCGLTLAQTAEDIALPPVTNMVLAIEGMDFVHSEMQIASLLEAGARVFALQYNRPNALTTGDCSETSPHGGPGLTDLGKRVVMRLLCAGAVLDLAHSSSGTRTDILDIATAQGCGSQIAYTHGAIREEADGDRVARLPGRFLYREEAARIVRGGGIIGLTPALLFTPSLERFASQIRRLVHDTNSAASIALGTDFGGISASALLPEVRSVTDLPRIGETLSERHGFTDSEVEAVLRTNATTWLRQALPLNCKTNSRV